MDVDQLTRAIKAQAIETGFDAAGVTSAGAADAAGLRGWMEAGYHGSMRYFEKQLQARTDVRRLVPGAKSILVLAVNYYQPAEGPGAALISRHAWGGDYHRVLRSKMKSLLASIREMAPGCEGRVFVDSGPVMEKYWAAKAGIGWQGKHSLIISPRYGSWIFLGEIITDLALVPDPPVADRCGECRRCIDACPTGAIVRPGVLDARRCIAYNTIELPADQPIPREIAAHMGTRLYGCDVCQQVCPWNEKMAAPGREAAFAPRERILRMTPAGYRSLSEIEFAEMFHHNPVSRMGYAGLQRTLRSLEGKDER